MRHLPIINNPLNGIIPDFTIFGIQFTQLWQKLLGAAWGIAILLAVAFIIMSVTKMATATAGGNPNDLKAARGQVGWSLLALALLACLGVIVGGVLSVFG